MGAKEGDQKICLLGYGCQQHQQSCTLWLSLPPGLPLGPTCIMTLQYIFWGSAKPYALALALILHIRLSEVDNGSSHNLIFNWTIFLPKKKLCLKQKKIMFEQVGLVTLPREITSRAWRRWTGNAPYATGNSEFSRNYTA